MDKNQGSESERTRLYVIDSSKEAEENMSDLEDYLQRFVAFPITKQAEIVNFFYFWWQRGSIIKEYYKGISNQARVQFKYKMIVCRRYCQRYLGVQLDFWFGQRLLGLDATIPIRIAFDRKELETTLEAIYKTHDPNFKEPIFSDSDEEQQPKKKKGFFTSVFDKVYQVLTKRMEKKSAAI